FQPVSWNKEQTKVTLSDPGTSKMTVYDINTTEITNDADINDDPIAPERSINGRFGIVRHEDNVDVIDVQTKEPVTLEAAPAVVGIAPKETQIAYTVTQRDGSSKLFIYDVNKKTSRMLTVLK
ncbi:MAG TPA: hypothetical protein VFH43_14675, partial [Candidatus Kapabacteria bacterium]|nr:hypothetical protein [Candidatus Kapabacteria bacterium]